MPNLSWMLEANHNLETCHQTSISRLPMVSEEIEGQLRLEYGKTVDSYQTIYRAIIEDILGDNSLSHGARGVFVNTSHH